MILIHVVHVRGEKDISIVMDFSLFPNEPLLVIRACLVQTSWMMKPDVHRLSKQLLAELGLVRKARKLPKLGIFDGWYRIPSSPPGTPPNLPTQIKNLTNNELLLIEVVVDTIVDFAGLGSGFRGHLNQLYQILKKEVSFRKLHGAPTIQELSLDISPATPYLSSP